MFPDRVSIYIFKGVFPMSMTIHKALPDPAALKSQFPLSE